MFPKFSLISLKGMLAERWRRLISYIKINPETKGRRIKRQNFGLPRCPTSLSVVLCRLEKCQMPCQFPHCLWVSCSVRELFVNVPECHLSMCKLQCQTVSTSSSVGFKSVTWMNSLHWKRKMVLSRRQTHQLTPFWEHETMRMRERETEWFLASSCDQPTEKEEKVPLNAISRIN